MIDKIFNVTLDMVATLQTQKIEFVRGDMKTCKLVITLENNYTPVNLTGLNVQFFLKKADGTVATYDSRYDVTIISITDATNGIVTVTLPLQALSAIGYALAQLSIIDSNNAKLTSQMFSIYIRDGWDSALASVNDVPVLQKLIQDVNTLKDQIDDAEVLRTNNEKTAITNANTATTSANTAAQSANTAATAANAAVKITNNDTSKSYTWKIQVNGGQPQLILEEAV